jgi:hypothetical protein
VGRALATHGPAGQRQLAGANALQPSDPNQEGGGANFEFLQRSVAQQVAGMALSSLLAGATLACAAAAGRRALHALCAWRGGEPWYQARS